MVADYDSWLLNQADKYCTGCEPKAEHIEYEYEGPDESPSQSITYNCEGCEEEDCEYWNDYNESQAERDEAILWDL